MRAVSGGLPERQAGCAQASDAEMQCRRAANPRDKASIANQVSPKIAEPVALERNVVGHEMRLCDWDET